MNHQKMKKKNIICVFGDTAESTFALSTLGGISVEYILFDAGLVLLTLVLLVANLASTKLSEIY